QPHLWRRALAQPDGRNREAELPRHRGEVQPARCADARARHAVGGQGEEAARLPAELPAGEGLCALHRLVQGPCQAHAGGVCQAMSARAATADVLLPDAWLSRTLGTPAFSLRLPVPRALDAELARLPDPAFCFAKVPEADAASAAALGAAGFRQVDMQVTLERGADPAPVAPGAEVRLAEPEDRDDVLNIAGSCFRFSRFHQDSRIGARTANKLK